MQQIQDRNSKIRFLQSLQKGTATISDLLPPKVVVWQQYMDEPQICISPLGEVSTEVEIGQTQAVGKENLINVIVILSR